MGKMMAGWTMVVHVEIFINSWIPDILKDKTDRLAYELSGGCDIEKNQR